MARFLIFLLFLVIECLPVTVKLVQRPGNYELALEMAAEAELKRAARDIRASEGLPGRSRPAAPVSQEDRIDQEARQLWQPTQTMPRDIGPIPDSGGSVPTPRPARPSDPLGEFRDLNVRRTQPEADPRRLVTRSDGSLRASGPVELPLDDNEI